ncbi:hypothetical protein D1F64_04550 [Breoghania sp. L-A4]|nr:hypothetical protein D1F64_04550 [Breoghania sp. L-A4]
MIGKFFVSVAFCAAMTHGSVAQDTTKYAIPAEDGSGYKINYQALGDATELSMAEKFQVARALRNGSGHIVSGVESIAGFGGKCKVNKFLGIPDGVDCTLTADPAATKVMSKLGSFALTNAICLVIDAEDGEVTEPICDGLLEAFVSKTLEPLIETCADQDRTTAITVDFKLVPPKLKPSARCG